MSVPEMMRIIGEKLESGASVKKRLWRARGCWDRTVIPVARVSYRFGAGGAKAAETISKAVAEEVRA